MRFLNCSGFVITVHFNIVTANIFSRSCLHAAFHMSLVKKTVKLLSSLVEERTASHLSTATVH